MSTNQIIEQLKQNDEDYEFYPTTDKMLNVIIDDLFHRGESISILDIGCGTCKLKRLLEDRLNAKKDEYDRLPFNLSKYYGIEKSEILINNLPDDVFILGTDFNNTTLIDKVSSVLFCNPPYSEYENWMERIIREGNFAVAYLIVPQRWKNNKNIIQALEDARIDSDIIGNDDFYDAERKARAVIDIVKLTKKKYSGYYSYSITNDDTFSRWFDDTFKVNSTEKREYDYEIAEKNKENIHNQLVEAPNKIEFLINKYNAELQRLYSTFSQLCSMDESVLKDIGVNFSSIKESLKNKIKNHKRLYWDMVFEELDEIRSRLTQASIDELKKQFEEVYTVDFTYSNIKSVLIWILKNAHKYSESQLVSFYKTLSNYENVVKYKSNQRVFQKDDWGYWNRDRYTHYCLTYRLVVDTLYFRHSTSRWNPTKQTYIDDYEVDGNKTHTVISDFCAIAYNLGFSIGKKEEADCFGEKFYIYDDNGKQLLEYKLFKNGNTHLKVNIELMKAINVEVARLLGWIKDKTDIKMEFPDELADGAEKYFGNSFKFQIGNSNLKLLS